MSPVALKLLTDAYRQYRRTGNEYIECQFTNSNEILDIVEGSRQLFEDGYIADVSEFLLDIPIAFSLNDPICFTLTSRGIEYMRTHGEF